ncbi:hypothetical protein MAR_012191 [Mya arenaria]|uniref:Receptor ligand binding region domain-containing protein n=1 Tax=Mya arenaria TaxID=6604 RepID=A0ABY7FZK4_MYAAR|nr:hypothetical protein MAR_012191 [Mya arenaria]
MAPAMIEDFKNDPDFPPLYPVKFERNKYWNAKDLLQDASAHARVFLMCVNADEMRTILYQAGMMGFGGEYVYIAIQLATISWWGTYRKFLQNDMMDQTLKKVYENVLILELINPVEDNGPFQDEIRDLALNEFDYTFAENETA